MSETIFHLEKINCTLFVTDKMCATSSIDEIRE